MDKYEVYLDKYGRVLALDQDSGNVYRVLIENDEMLRRAFVLSAETLGDCPYEIYEEDGELRLLSDLSAATYKVTLVLYEEVK